MKQNMRKYAQYKDDKVGSPTGKAKRIIIDYNEKSDTMNIKKGSSKPYPDWQNQHGPVGASVDGVTEAEADLMVALTASILGKNIALMEDDDDWTYSSTNGGSHGGAVRAAAATIAAGAQVSSKSRNSHHSGSSSKSTPALVASSPTKLTASERAAKLAEEMEAKADADQNSFGLLHTFQEEQRLKSQRGSVHPSQASHGSRLPTPSVVVGRRVGSPHQSSSPTNSSSMNFNMANNVEVDENVNDADEAVDDVVRLDITTPGGLAGHILATGGYGCPDPTKPNPVIVKQPLNFPEDEDRGAKTPTKKSKGAVQLYSPIKTGDAISSAQNVSITQSPTKKLISVKDVRMSKQPWALQEAVLDAQIMADAQLDRATLKTIGSANQPVNFATPQTPVRSAKATMLLPHYHQHSTDLTRLHMLQLEQTHNREIYNTTGTIPLQALLGVIPSPRAGSTPDSPNGPMNGTFPQQGGVGLSSTKVMTRPTSAFSHSSGNTFGATDAPFGQVPSYLTTDRRFGDEGSPLTSGRLDYSHSKVSRGQQSAPSQSPRAGREHSMSSIAAESPFMKQKQLIADRILKNTVACVDEKSSRFIRATSVQKRRLEWASANQIGGSDSSIWQSGEGSSGPFSGSPSAVFSSAFVGNIVGKGIVSRGRRTSIKMLPPTSMTSKDVFIAQQRLLNANLRQMAEEEAEASGSPTRGPYGAFAADDENLASNAGDTDEALGNQYDRLEPFLRMEDQVETRRFLCELWARHITLASSLDAFTTIVAKNRASHTIRHVAIPMVMRWIKTYRRNKVLQKEISSRMEEVIIKRPNSAVLRQLNDCLKDWSDAMVDSLLEEARFVPFKADQFVFFQGEPTKDLYLIVSGEAEVIVMDRSNPDKKRRKSRRSENGKIVASLGPGRLFGEIAGITNQSRCASVRCVTSCDLLCVTNTDFARAGSSLPERSWQLLKRQCQERRVVNIGKVFPLTVDDVQRHQMFAHWSHTAAEALAEAFKPIFLPPGEYVFMPPLINENSCVIIVSGVVKVTYFDDDGHPIGEPKLFGPSSLIGEKETVMVVKRSYNAVCVEALEGYVLSRGDYITAAMHNATFAAKSRELVAARIAETWVRPPPPKQFLDDPVLSYLVSEEVLRSIWEFATPKLIWQSELMLLAGQPCDYISVVVRGTFHERASTTRATYSKGGPPSASSPVTAFPRLQSSYSFAEGSVSFPTGNTSGPFLDSNTSSGPQQHFVSAAATGGNVMSIDFSPPEISVADASSSNVNSKFDTRTSVSHNSAVAANTSIAGGFLSIAGSGGQASTKRAGAPGNLLGAPNNINSLNPSPGISRSSSNLAAALLSASPVEEWNPATDAAFLPPYLKRLEQRTTHRQYEDGLENGEAVVLGPLEIGLNHKFYLRTVWCTGTCHVWQIHRSVFESTIKKEHPRVWDAIISPKTMETILENADNLDKLVYDSNPPRKAGI